MIKTHATAIIEDQEGINNITFDVNFNKDRKDLIKVTLANKVSTIRKDDLWNFVFSIVQTSQQQRMIPVKKEDFTVYNRQHHVKVEKDLKAGDEVIVNCKLDVTQRVEEHLRKEFEEKNKKIVSPYNDNVL